MRPAALALQRFADKWGDPDLLPELIDSGDLAIAEHRMGRRFPEAYVHAVTLVGLPLPTLSLSNSLMEADADASDIEAFFTPEEITAGLNAHRTAATPASFVAFASDSCGDRYGFLCTPGNSARPAEGGVFQMDHENGEVMEVAGSFLDWLLDYNRIAFVHFDEA